MRKIARALLIFIAIAVSWHFISPNILESDSFFYLGKAHLIREAGLTDSGFPWMQFSVTKETGSSLWFGFALFLLPFSYLDDAALGIKLAGVLLTVFALFSCFGVATRHRLKWPLFWPFLMLVAAPNVTSQLLMTRPQTATIGFAVLLLSFLIEGKFWQVFLTTFLLVWIHMNFAWMAIAIGGIVLIARIIIERQFEVLKTLALIAGVLAGWLARPNPLGAAKLFYIQVVKQILEKQGSLPLLFGNENLPLSSKILFLNFGVILLIWTTVLAILGWSLWQGARGFNEPKKRILITSSAILSLIFFLLSITVTRRSYNFWVAFGILLTATVFTGPWEASTNRKQYIGRGWAGGSLIVALVFLVFYSGAKTIDSLERGYPPDYVKAAGEWLGQNTQPGDLVFNLRWPYFSPLFLWDRKNYYINGLDPIFQYDYDPALYWKFHYLAANQTTDQTCGKITCQRSDMEDTYKVLKNDFGAKYILIGRRVNRKMEQFLAGSSNFEKVFETVNDAIYKIK